MEGHSETIANQRENPQPCTTRKDGDPATVLGHRVRATHLFRSPLIFGDCAKSAVPSTLVRCNDYACKSMSEFRVRAGKSGDELMIFLVCIFVSCPRLDLVVNLQVNFLTHSDGTNIQDPVR